MAIKVLLIALNYHNEKKYRLYGSISALCQFHKRLLRYGYLPSEILFLIDNGDTAFLPSTSSSPSTSTSSPTSDTRVELIRDAIQVMEILKTMVKESQQGDKLIFFFVGHGIDDEDVESVLMDLGIDGSDISRGALSGHAIEKATGELPDGILFYPLIDCCDSSAMIRALKQYRPPSSSGVENICRIVFTTCDNAGGSAYEGWVDAWQVYCSIRILDMVHYKGKDMLPNLELAERIDKRMERRELIGVEKGGKQSCEQHPGLYCSHEQSLEKFLLLS